eukprot:comp23720_c0_seq1/m.40847 comp23720_c0_seq1/g.40847  ORF comp23720_c0_seq1/g.40847 comp23720_c0_seq1/m.40847 type:complete len:618 (-) comp23720_c0_seq1:401-2254(-)
MASAQAVRLRALLHHPGLPWGGRACALRVGVVGWLGVREGTLPARNRPQFGPKYRPPSPPKPQYVPLPIVKWAPDQEFKTVRPYHPKQTFTRLVRVTLEKIMDPGSMMLLTTSAIMVLLFGTYEAVLTLKPAILHTQEGYMYVAKYALHNSLSSIVWETEPAALIARSLDMDVDVCLRHFDDEYENLSPEDAKTKISIASAFVGRCIAGGFMVIAQLLRIFTLTIRASDQYFERVLMGAEPPLVGVDERVVRFCSKESSVTEVSMERLGEHLVPVMDYTPTMRDMIERQSLQGQLPVYWRVMSGRYGTTRAWSRFTLEKCNLIKTTNGRALLYLEADLTPTGALLFDRGKMDITEDDACQGFRMLEHRARHKGLRPFRVQRVYLGDLSRLIWSGGGHKYTLRERLIERKEVDILIDARAYVIHRILEWCRMVSVDTNVIIVETTNQACFQVLQKLLGHYQYRVVDADDPNCSAALDSGIDPIKIPRLVIYEKTMQTVNSVWALVESRKVDPTRCCAVFDEAQGLEGLRVLEEQTQFLFRAICTSSLFDDLFRRMRIWSRLGFLPDEIQRELDIKYNNRLLSTHDLELGYCHISDRDEMTRAQRDYYPICYNKQEKEK